MSDWHLRKDITVGNILVVISMVIAGLAAWNNLNTRVAILEEHIGEEVKDRERDVNRICTRLDRIEDLIRDMSAK